MHERPLTIGLTVWRDTPHGIYYNQIPFVNQALDSRERHYNHCNKFDLWMHAQNANPLLKELDNNQLTVR